LISRKDYACTIRILALGFLLAKARHINSMMIIAEKTSCKFCKKKKIINSNCLGKKKWDDYLVTTLSSNVTAGKITAN